MSAVTTTPEQHGLVAHSDGGWEAEGRVVPVQTRSGRFTSYLHEDFPEVTSREADWKLTPIELVRPLIDDALDGSPYEYTATEVAGGLVEWIDRTSPLVGSAGTPEERASANAWSSFEKALSITVTGEDNAELTVARN